jgi:hypothetical protein
MSESVILPSFTAGKGWRAEIYRDLICVTIDASATDDPLVSAVDTLLPWHRRQFWYVEWSHEDAYGNDVYLLTYGS